MSQKEYRFTNRSTKKPRIHDYRKKNVEHLFSMRKIIWKKKEKNQSLLNYDIKLGKHTKSRKLDMKVKKSTDQKFKDK